MTQPPLDTSALRVGWRVSRTGLFLLAAMATILIAGVYAAYRINALAPDALGVASQPAATGERDEPTATPAVPMAVESKPVEPEPSAAVEAFIPATDPEAPKRASARQQPVRVAVPKRASAQQRPAPGRRPRAGATPPVARSLTAPRVGPRIAETRKALRSHPWRAMHVSLARCGGDLIARIVCQHRVRRHFCEGRWGQAPECAGGVANDHGQ